MLWTFTSHDESRKDGTQLILILQPSGSAGSLSLLELFSFYL